MKACQNIADAVPSSKTKKFINNKKTLAVCSAVLAALVLLIVIFVAAASSAGGGYVYDKGEVQTVTDGNNIYFINSKGGISDIEVKTTSFFKICGVGDCALFEDGDNNTLYYYNGKSAIRLSEGAGIYTAVLSTDGKRAVYMLNNKNSTAAFGYDIYSYYNGKTTKIAENAYMTAVSPDGKTVAYQKHYDTETNSFNSFYNCSGKEIPLGENIDVFRISNGGRYIYLEEQDSEGISSYFVQTGNDSSSKVKLSHDLSKIFYFNFYFNYDVSEIMYADNSGTYISVKGKEPVKISSSALTPLVPEGVFNGSATQLRHNPTIVVKSFSDKFYISRDYKVVYLDSKNETHTAVIDPESVFLANDGKTLIYLKNGSIKKTDGKKADAEPVTLVEDGAVSLAVAKDGKTVFYENVNGKIYFQKGASEPMPVTDDNIDDYGIFNGNTFCYLSDGVLYTASSGKGKKLGNFSGRLSLYNVSDFLITVYTVNDGRYYVSTNGKSFKPVNEN